MANSLSSFAPEFWAKEAQRSLFVENKAMAIADTTLRNLVAGEGATVDRVIMSYPASSTYTPGSDISNVNLTGSKEQLTIGTWFASKVTVDDTEKRQSIISIGQLAAKRMMADHNNRIEQAVLAEASNATWALSDGNVGGTTGNPIVLTTANIPQVFTAADTKLDAVDAPKAGRTAVVGGHFMSTLKLQQAARPSPFSDGVNTRGVVAQLFGWDILYSNNLPYSASLSFGTIPTAADTITIAGVQFQAAANGAATNAGDYSISTTADLAAANFALAVNGTGTPGASTYIDISAENRFLLTLKRRVVATYATPNMAIAGYGDIVVSAVPTPAGNKWSSQKQTSLFLVAGAISIIVQIPPVIEVVRNPNQFADIVKSLLGFGKKTYADGAREMVSVPIDASTSDWS